MTPEFNKVIIIYLMSIYFNLVMKRNNIFNYQLIIFLFAFTFFSKNVYSQCIIPNEFVGNTGSNMTIAILEVPEDIISLGDTIAVFYNNDNIIIISKAIQNSIFYIIFIYLIY